jgi:outer membrane biosynthesis protein TonB
VRGQSPHDVPKKRGRPKKEPVPEPVPVPEPEPVPKKKPKAKPKVKSAALAERAGRADLTTIVEEARFSVNDLSNAQLISELVNRQRATQREMKTNLYRSFVM